MSKRVLTVVLLTLAVPASANAAIVHVGGAHKERYREYSIYSSNHGAAYYDAGPGERNRLKVSTVLLDDGSKRVTFHDRGAVIVVGKDCTSVDEHTAYCDDAPDDRHLTYTEVRLGDEDDTLDVEREYVTASGGSGDDVLRGGELNNELYAGTGRDRLLGGPHDDVLVDGDRSGARGDAGPGRDVLDGGGGHNFVNYERHRRRVTVDLRRKTGHGERGEDDVVRNVQDAAGGRGADRLVGVDDTRFLRGHGGDDVLIGGDRAEPASDYELNEILFGGTGRDRLHGRRGNDLLRPGPGRDSLSCGAGTDTVRDPVAGELLPRSCEAGDIRKVFGGEFRFVFPPNPIAISRRAVVFRLGCSLDEFMLSAGYYPTRSCTHRVSLRDASGRTLARARRYTSNQGPSYEGERVRMRLTRRGRALTARRRGVRATLEVHGFRYDGRKATVAWTVRLKR